MKAIGFLTIWTAIVGGMAVALANPLTPFRYEIAGPRSLSD